MLFFLAPPSTQKRILGLVGARSRGRMAPDGHQTRNRPAAEFAPRRALLQGKTDYRRHASMGVCSVR
jgi:hypothetical protein